MLIFYSFKITGVKKIVKILITLKQLEHNMKNWNHYLKKQGSLNQ
jgi:hypothetical protein